MTGAPVRIEAVVKGGLGLARDAEGVVLVEGALPGEIVHVARLPDRRGAARATVSRVVSAAPERRAAPCPLYGRCGGCDFMHATADGQRAMRAAILVECLERLGKIREVPAITTVASPEYGYRRRARIHVASRGGRLELGYYRSRSRDIEDMEDCPLLTEGLRGLLPELRRDPAGLLALASEITLLQGDTAISAAMRGGPELATRRKSLLKWLAPLGVSELAIATPEGAFGVTAEGVAVTVGTTTLVASARAFFQTNAPLLPALVDAVVGPLPARPGRVWDLYAGVGLFSGMLRRRCRDLTAVESDPQALPLLARNLGKGVRVMGATEMELLRRREPHPDVAIVDPPRSGLPRAARDLLARCGAPRIALVGCDPAAFATDLGGLVRAGYRIESLSVIDLYPQTSHVEAVAHLV